MRTILFTVFCALVLNVQAYEIKKDTIDRYIIDKQVVARFNGSQLEGKTISKYMIAYKTVGNVVERNHVIYTGSNKISLNTSGNPSKIKYEGLIIVNGKEVPNERFGSIKTEDIANMEIYKPGSKVANSYGEKGKNGVMMITTKAGKDMSNIYIIDGVRAKKADVDKLSPNKIASMSVDKREGISVIEIKTKK